jgi:hypothetical protein
MALIGAGRLDRFPKEDVRLRRGLGQLVYVPFIGANQDVDLGVHSITALRFLSTELVLAPFVVASTVVVANLNANFLQGHPASDFVTSVTGTAPVVSSGGQTPAISITPVDATHAGSVPLSGAPATNVYLQAAVTTGAVSWQQIAYADISGVLWQRVGTVLSPTTTGDSITTTGTGTFTTVNATSTTVSYQIGGVTFIHGKLSGGTPTQWNVFVGAQAGNATFTGTNNIGIGYQALQSVTTSSSNTAIGSGALKSQTTGFAGTGSNVALGSGALGLCADGYFNFGLGDATLANITSGFRNVALGYAAGNHAATSANNNCYVGNVSGFNATGSFNTCVGNWAGFTGTTLASSVCIGYQAGYYETGTNKLFIDNQSRASEADGRVKALVYGVFAATVADQSITFNVGAASFAAGNVTTTGAISGDSFVATKTAVAGNAVVVAYGQLYEDSAGSTITVTTAGTYYGWVTATDAGINSKVSFTNNATADRLTIGTGGDGVYRVTFSVCYTATNNDVCHWTIHKNNVAQSAINSETKVNLLADILHAGSTGLLSLVATDFVDLRLTSATNGTVATVNHCSLTIDRVG